MKRTCSAFCLFLVLSACAAGASNHAVPRHGLVVDDAEELAGLLPEGATECVAARPALLDASRTARAALLSTASPLAWLPQLHVVAFAQARQSSGVRAGGSVLLLRFGVSREAARRTFSMQRDVRLAFAEEGRSTCEDAECIASTGLVTFLDEHTARIVVGFWTHSERGVRCDEVLQLKPSALEVWQRESDHDYPLTRSLFLGTNGVRITYAPFDPSSSELTDSRFSDLFNVEAQRDLELSIEDGLHTGTREVRWDDLQLAVDDATRARAAHQQEHSERPTLILADAVNVHDDDAFAEQLALRVHGANSQAGDLEVLLTRRVEAVPGDADGVDRLLHLYTTQRRFGDAIALVDRVLSRADAHAGELREAARAAAAHMSAGTLAPRLVRDGLCTERDAQPLASLIVRALPPEFQSYGNAERASLAEFHYAREHGRVSLHSLAAPVRAPMSALPAALVGMLGATRTTPSHYLVRVRGSTIASGSVVTFTEGARVEIFSLVIADGLHAAWLRGTERRSFKQDMLGGLILENLGFTGACEISVFDEQVQTMTPRLVVRGSVADDNVLTITHVSTSTRDEVWQAVERYFWAPLANTPRRTFPAPHVVVHPESAEGTLEFLGFMASRDASCDSVSNTEVRCAPTPGDEEAFYTSLFDFTLRRVIRVLEGAPASPAPHG